MNKSIIYRIKFYISFYENDINPDVLTDLLYEELSKICHVNNIEVCKCAGSDIEYLLNIQTRDLMVEDISFKDLLKKASKNIYYGFYILQQDAEQLIA